MASTGSEYNIAMHRIIGYELRLELTDPGLPDYSLGDLMDIYMQQNSSSTGMFFTEQELRQLKKLERDLFKLVAVGVISVLSGNALLVEGAAVAAVEGLAAQFAAA